MEGVKRGEVSGCHPGDGKVWVAHEIVDDGEVDLAGSHGCRIVDERERKGWRTGLQRVRVYVV